MKRAMLYFFVCLFLLEQGFASEYSFIAKENGKVLVSEGDCGTPYAPESTFKIPLSLIGFDSGIFKNESDPSWSLAEGTDPYINVCRVDHNPRTWMRDSCVWYSRILTSQLGMEKFQDYVKKFSYGNMDLSGGLTDAWLSSSLKISPEAQTEFIQKLLDRKFSLSASSYDRTKKIMFIQEMPGGWKLYGKTGNGKQVDNDGHKTELQHGWFVGYIEKENRRIVFASHILDREKQNIFASFRARNEALIKLWYIIDELEKV